MSYIAAGNTTTTALTTYGDTTGNLVFTTGGANTTALTLSNTQAATFAGAVTITGATTHTGNAAFSNITTTGSIGVGTATPSTILQVSNASTPRISVIDTRNSVQTQLLSDNLAGYVGTTTNHPFVCVTNNTEKLRISTAGAVTTPYQPAFLASGTGGTVTVSAGSNIPFNSLATSFVGSNRNSGYNTSTYLYTAPVAGLYYFYAQAYIFSSGFSFSWFKNGTQLEYQDVANWSYTNGATGITQISGGTMVIDLAAGDYISTRVRTGAGDVSVYMGHSCFLGYLIG